MRFSVHIPTAAEGLAHPVPFTGVDEIVAIARAAETLGYDGVWGNYHITTQGYVADLWPDPPSYYDTLVVLAAIAVQTTRLELGTAVLPPHFFVMPALAKQVATLDRLSAGRMRLGLGVGAYREEFEAVWPGTGGHRGQWLDEALVALRALFAESSASFAGKYVSFRDVASYPKPIQDPLPLYVGGHHLRTVERAARAADGWIPGWQPIDEMARRITMLRELTEAVGRPPSAVEVAPQLSATIADTDALAVADYERSGLVAHRRSLAYTGRDLSRQVGCNLIGSPATIRAKVQQLAGIGVDHLCALWFPTSTVQEMLSQMEWFAGEVVAPLRKEEA
ncbi:MAG: TIGR03619 family F420-dependent LLM class oxidoreductase [Acidimicrobiales bacterium]